MTKKQLEAKVLQLEREIESLKRRVAFLQQMPPLPTQPFSVPYLPWQPAYPPTPQPQPHWANPNWYYQPTVTTPGTNLTPNEIREIRGLEPCNGGDDPLVSTGVN